MEGVNGREEVCLGHFYHSGGVSEETKALAEFIGGCGAGRLYCCIEPEGMVQPCVFMPIPLGNVRDRPFLDIWHGSPVLASLRDRSALKGECGNCRNRYICGGSGRGHGPTSMISMGPTPGASGTGHTGKLSAEKPSGHRRPRVPSPRRLSLRVISANRNPLPL